MSIELSAGTANGYVIAVPASSTDTPDPIYTIKLLSGDTTSVPTSTSNLQIHLPSWLQHDAKVRFTISRLTHQGRLCLSPPNDWSFVKKNKLGNVVFKHPLPDLHFNDQSLINSLTLQPGWTDSSRIVADHFTATSLQNPCPSSLDKALLQNNPDHSVWLRLYDEEYDSLDNMDVFEPISLDYFRTIQYKCGKPTPTMCLMTIKYKNGYPGRAKSRIVVLGNQQQVQYEANEKYAPVLSQVQFRTLLSVAVHHKRVLRQGDVKNAFCHAILPDGECVVV